MKIVVIGGTGRVGSNVTPRSQGSQALPHRLWRRVTKICPT